MDVKKKHEIETALAQENQQISSGQLKEENPLDLSENFRIFCEACRRNDLKVCQEMISNGVNINARDRFDYTPLILVSGLSTARTWDPNCVTRHRIVHNNNRSMTRLAFADMNKSPGCC
jgi:ankyrin repeat protein